MQFTFWPLESTQRKPDILLDNSDKENYSRTGQVAFYGAIKMHFTDADLLISNTLLQTDGEEPTEM